MRSVPPAFRPVFRKSFSDEKAGPWSNSRGTSTAHRVGPGVFDTIGTQPLPAGRRPSIRSGEATRGPPCRSGPRRWAFGADRPIPVR